MNTRKITALAVVLAAGLGLAACAGTTPSSTGGTTTSPTGDATTNAIIASTVKACGFLPTVSTVTGIIASFVPGGAPINSLVTSIAQSICGAVAPKAGMRRGAARPEVNGVVVEGRFVH
jgi:hypothetical protein